MIPIIKYSGEDRFFGNRHRSFFSLGWSDEKMWNSINFSNYIKELSKFARDIKTKWDWINARRPYCYISGILYLAICPSEMKENHWPGERSWIQTPAPIFAKTYLYKNQRTLETVSSPSDKAMLALRTSHSHHKMQI